MQNAVPTDCIVNGIIGASAPYSPVPQMFVLFLLLSIVEDCGYMGASPLRNGPYIPVSGLSGKSFIPLLISLWLRSAGNHGIQDHRERQRPPPTHNDGNLILRSETSRHCADGR